MQVTTIGLDIAKHVFQVHGIDAAEKVVVRKRLRRSQVLEFFKALPPCLVGMDDGALPHGMGVARLADLPAEWSRQRRILGLGSSL
jgi:hypothetical protein